MKTVSPQDLSPAAWQALLQGSVAPRPIAFASTTDQAGNINLSPFSFFNLFSAIPPILIFSPARRVRDNTTKHTLENIYEIPEVVINLVDYALVEQVSLASTEYEKGVNEFVKAGLKSVESVLVRPPRVAESPVAFECKVRRIIPLGTQGGAGNLVICEIILAHFKEHIFDNQGFIDPHRIDLVARLGRDFYSRASGNAIFEVEKPLLKKGIGVDQLPEKMRHSAILTGSNLGKLANTEKIPSEAELANIEVEMPENWEKSQLLAKKLLDKNQIQAAWKVLLKFS